MNVKFLTFLLSVLFILSCSSVKQPEIPESYNIRIGSGGGALGQWRGYTIDSNANAYSWSGLKQGDNPVLIGTLNIDSVKFAIELIKSYNLLDVKYIQPHNYSASIALRISGKENLIIWNPNERNDTCDIANKFYSRVTEIIQSIQK